MMMKKKKKNPYTQYQKPEQKRAHAYFFSFFRCGKTKLSDSIVWFNIVYEKCMRRIVG